jgi:hypothetical protein
VSDANGGLPFEHPVDADWLVQKPPIDEQPDIRLPSTFQRARCRIKTLIHRLPYGLLIDHFRTKPRAHKRTASSMRFHKIVLQELDRIVFRNKLYRFLLDEPRNNDYGNVAECELRRRFSSHEESGAAI